MYYTNRYTVSDHCTLCTAQYQVHMHASACGPAYRPSTWCSSFSTESEWSCTTSVTHVWRALLVTLHSCSSTWVGVAWLPWGRLCRRRALKARWRAVGTGVLERDRNQHERTAEQCPAHSMLTCPRAFLQWLGSTSLPPGPPLPTSDRPPDRLTPTTG